MTCFCKSDKLKEAGIAVWVETYDLGGGAKRLQQGRSGCRECKARTDSKDIETIVALRKCLKTKDRVVREAACLALGHLGIEAVIEELVNLWPSVSIKDWTYIFDHFLYLHVNRPYCDEHMLRNVNSHVNRPYCDDHLLRDVNPHVNRPYCDDHVLRDVNPHVNRPYCDDHVLREVNPDVNRPYCDDHVLRDVNPHVNRPYCHDHVLRDVNPHVNRPYCDDHVLRDVNQHAIRPYCDDHVLLMLTHVNRPYCDDHKKAI
ncbi:unnamed protein product [Mytilus coruscus]|uniref:Uncharacterized protein n=1 Tax=Mytilus coruscus TaxID=42192 RepID=A0A6J8AL64_MYTCO|nr:unnamed protein product [Mytilus coruscus]